MNAGDTKHGDMCAADTRFQPSEFFPIDFKLRKARHVIQILETEFTVKRKGEIGRAHV